MAKQKLKHPTGAKFGTSGSGKVCKCSKCGPRGKKQPYSIYRDHQFQANRPKPRTVPAHDPSPPVLSSGSGSSSQSMHDMTRTTAVDHGSPINASSDAIQVQDDEDNALFDASDARRMRDALAANSSSSSDSESDDRFVPDPQEIASRYAMLEDLAAKEGGDDADDDDDENGDEVASDGGEWEDVNDGDASRPSHRSPLTLEQVLQGPQAAPTPSQFPLMYPEACVPDENSPDPFHSPIPHNPPPPFQTTHEIGAVRILYLLVIWLHSQFHVPVRALNAILVIGRLMLIAAGLNTLSTIGTALTYQTVQSHAGVEPSFSILPVCVACIEPHPSDYSGDTCMKCNHPLFKSDTRNGPKRRKRNKKRRPTQQFAYKSISDQLPGLLSLPGMEDLLDAWRSQTRTPGVYNDLFDGNVCKEILGYDGLPFFRNDAMDKKGPEGELRIAVTLGIDWFSYHRSQIAGLHTSCPMSFCVANLPPEYRYRTANLMLSGIMPGPKEQNPDQVQRYLRIMVNDLLRLWKDGIRIPTPSCPEGRRVRVILIGVICDKPAAHKIGGFGSHSHTKFCTKCWITQQDKSDPKAFKSDGYRRRTNAEHRRLCDKYRKLKSQSARDAFVKKEATRWSELARLPYFDLCRMIVVDPMHNLLLGVTKTHFYHIWIQHKILRKNHELRTLHKLLDNFEIPSHLATLPALVGEPAGGSLTADQWLLMATVFGPLVIPQIWREHLPANHEQARKTRIDGIAQRIAKKKREAEAKKAAQRRKKGLPVTDPLPVPTVQDDAEWQDEPSTLPSTSKRTSRKSSKKRKNASGEDAGDDDEDESLPSTLSPEDPAHFLCLSMALKFWMRRTLTEEHIALGQKHLEEYLGRLVELYGPDVVRPNHHYAVHTSDFIRDYGPLYGFWTFLFERLNKVLKSYKTSNHLGGEIEVTFFREFHRAALVSRTLFEASASTDEALSISAELMAGASADERGTVQALARELDEVQPDATVLYHLDGRPRREEMPDPVYLQVVAYMKAKYPDLLVESDRIARSPQRPLSRLAWHHRDVIMNGRRFTAYGAPGATTRNCLVSVALPGAYWVGQLHSILSIEPNGLEEPISFGVVRFLKPLMDARPHENPDKLSELLGVKFVEPDTYIEDPACWVVSLSDIKSHVSRQYLNISGRRVWGTITLDQEGQGI